MDTTSDVLSQTLTSIASEVLSTMSSAAEPTASSIVPTSASTTDSAAIKASASAAISSLSVALASVTKAMASESAIASGNEANPPFFKIVGIILAVASGLLIGSSFVFKKKGLLSSQAKYGTVAGESHSYLKSGLWWFGMILMVLGEIMNLGAYAMASAVLVTPLGALSVVVCAILSSIFLKEKLSLFGKLGAGLSLLGSMSIAINAPSTHAAGNIREFQKLFLGVGFLVWGSLCIVTSVLLVIFVVPRYGRTHMLVHITICSLIGGLSVSTISGLGSAIILTIRGHNQFNYWFIYFLIIFVTVTLLVEINYLNHALALFNTAMVTPTYYVIFTFCTLVTSIILYQGLDTDAIGIMTLVLSFLVICAGITLLQLSKIDPEELARDANGLEMDDGTSLLLRASRSHISHEKGIRGEEPGVEAVRGGLGIIGSIVRARSSRRLHTSADEYALNVGEDGGLLNTRSRQDLERYELSDDPVRRTMPNMPIKRDTAISFVDGSDEPHGHHAGEKSSQLASSQDASKYHTEPARHLSPASPNTSGPSLSTLQEGSFDGNGGSSIRPVGPRPAGGSLPRSTQAPDLRNMWQRNASQEVMQPGASPDSSPGERSLRDGGLGERSSRHYPGQGLDDEDELELLSPRGIAALDYDEEDQRHGSAKKSRH